MAGISWAVIRTRQAGWLRRGRVPAALRNAAALGSMPRRQAIEPGREIHLHLNVTPDQLAAILRYYSGED